VHRITGVVIQVYGVVVVSWTTTVSFGASDFLFHLLSSNKFYVAAFLFNLLHYAVVPKHSVIALVSENLSQSLFTWHTVVVLKLPRHRTNPIHSLLSNTTGR
jgi:hypothetical protein